MHIGYSLMITLLRILDYYLEVCEDIKKDTDSKLIATIYKTIFGVLFFIWVTVFLVGYFITGVIGYRYLWIIAILYWFYTRL